MERDVRLAQIDEITRNLRPREAVGDVDAVGESVKLSAERAALLNLDLVPPLETLIELDAPLEKLIEVRRLMRQLGLTQVAIRDIDVR